MNCEQVITSILVPLVSACIGGGLTLLGVRLSLRSERKKEEKNRIDSAKPWLYSLDRREDQDWKSVYELFFSSDGRIDPTQKPTTIIIKNTDNGIAILDRIITETTEYYPVAGKVIEKGKKAHLYIQWAKSETLVNMRLQLHDVYGNEYCYEILQGNESNENSWHIKDIQVPVKKKQRKIKNAGNRNC